MKVVFVLLIFLFHTSALARPALEVLHSENPFQKTRTNQLTLLAYPAGYRLDWTSPGALVRKVIWNTVTRQEHPLSHLDVFLRCENEKPVLAGMSRVKTWKTYGDVLIRGHSLNLLTSVFPGYLLSPDQILGYLRPAIQDGHVRAISFKLNKNNCRRLLSYYREYSRRKYHERYSGFRSNLYAGEGAGCAAYGISYLQVAGLLDSVFKDAWTRRISVPVRLLSEGKNPPGMWSYVFGANEAWAQTDEPSVPLTVYDPEKIFDWVHEQSIYRFTSPVRSHISYVEKAIELTIDGREAFPQDDYWRYSWP